MTQKEEKVNQFLVNVYNHVLKQEEEYISKELSDQITLNEIHVIEAVKKRTVNGIVTMSQISEELQISLGSLNISSNRLIKKGYLEKILDKNDKRKKKLVVTKKGYDVLKVHDEWHARLIGSLKVALSDQEFDVLSETLGKLTEFFERKDKNE